MSKKQLTKSSVNGTQPLTALFQEQDTVRDTIKRIVTVFQESACAIRPHFFLTGNTGTGKTYTVKAIAAELDVPFLEINAAQLTAEGVSGSSLSKSMRPLREHWNIPNIIFVDEFDKLIQRNGQSTSEHLSGVQDEFLSVLEADKAVVFTEYGKYEPVLVTNSLFIFAGAFNGMEIESADDLQENGLRPEFLGRVPLIYRMPDISLDSLKEAVPEMKLFKDYLKYLDITPSSAKGKNILSDVRKQLHELHKNKGGIGIRQINYLIHQRFIKEINP